MRFAIAKVITSITILPVTFLKPIISTVDGFLEISRNRKCRISLHFISALQVNVQSDAEYLLDTLHQFRLLCRIN